MLQAKTGYDPRYESRPLKTAIQECVESDVATTVKPASDLNRPLCRGKLIAALHPKTFNPLNDWHGLSLPQGNIKVTTRIFHHLLHFHKIND